MDKSSVGFAHAALIHTTNLLNWYQTKIRKIQPNFGSTGKTKTEDDRYTTSKTPEMRRKTFALYFKHRSEMNPLTLKTLFTIGIVLSLIIRFPYQRTYQSNTFIDDRKTPQEMLILILIFIGMLLLPFIYVFSPVLNHANYSVPVWVNSLGIAIFAIALWLFWRAHHDLGQNWSPTLQIRTGHTLISTGVYHYVRHPMYTSVFLWCIAQILLLPNWIAGLSGIISFSIAYATRIKQEEQMLLDQFGDQYETYRQRTKQLIPYLF